MKILHICSYYFGNKLYMNLIKNLSLKGIDQEIFIPVKNREHIGKNQVTKKYGKIRYHYKNILKKYHRLFFYNKINKQLQSIEESIDLLNIDFIHAHTLFSDGGTAYKLNKKYGIKYILNIRNTDINVFYKYAIHLRPFMYKVLINSSAIVFISDSYKQKMSLILPPKILNKVKEKFYIIPNGIDEYWHKNNSKEKNHNKTYEIKLLFIGRIDKNKNVETIIRTCQSLINIGYNATLDIIGNGPLENNNKELVKKLSIEDKITFHGYIKDKAKISSIMNECDIFVMPSYKETFGLVYIEAMSKGMPVIYTKGEGIDGIFRDGEVGYSVNPDDINLIVESIIRILNNYREISSRCIVRSKEFNWGNVSKQYIQIYN